MGKKFVKDDPRINRKGAPKTSPEIKAVRKITLEYYTKLISKYLYSNPDEMKEAFKNPKTPALELAVIAIIRDSIRHGKIDKLEALLSRLLGKLESTVNIKGELNHNTIMEYIRGKDVKK